MTLPKQVDLIVAGAGTAGAGLALFAAQAGFSVLCLDRRPLDDAGARWINGVPTWLYGEIGLPAPQEPELRGHAERFNLIAGYDGPRLQVTGHRMHDVDMRLLLSRLQREAERAGATLVGDCSIDSVAGQIVHTPGGSCEANWIVDATGLSGINLLGSPKVDKKDICAAAQEVRHCDEARAREYFSRHGADYGDTLCFSSVEGGYSIVNVQGHGDELDILTGSIPGEGHPSGRKMLDDFVAQHDWIGETKYGGARAIPVRRPFAHIAKGNYAAIGDAACQVFPAHGSGIAPQLIAARLLADNLKNGRGLIGYQVQFQRKWGRILAAYDVFRRFSQTLSAAELAALIQSGIMTAPSSRAALEQRMPDLPAPSELAGILKGLGQQPLMAGRMLSVLGKMIAVQSLYASFPKNPRHVGTWAKAVDALFAGL